VKIVLGIDNSNHAQRALDFVCRSKWPERTTVLVVSSVPLPVAVLTATVPLTGLEVGVWLKELTRLHTRWVERAEKRLEEAGLKARTMVPQGDPRHVLVDVARKQKADLIVIGAQGRSAVNRLLLGSVATHVVSHAPCTVVVVKREESKSRRPRRRTARG